VGADRLDPVEPAGDQAAVRFKTRLRPRSCPANLRATKACGALHMINAALDCAVFPDQAHLTRTVTARFGMTPGRLSQSGWLKGGEGQVLP